MAEDRKVIRPDLDFVRRIVASGGDTVKQCMQCANCSVACELSPTDQPFPRKEMILAQWGLKEELFNDPDIWLCFGCTDCSIQCPRGARPGDVLAAVRKEVIREYTPIGSVQKALESPKYLPILILVPVVLWSLIYLVFGKAENEAQHYFDGIFPPGILEPLLGVMTMTGCLIFALGAFKYWKSLLKAHPAPAGANFVGAVMAAAGDIISHAKFRKCEAGESRALGHMLMFYGFSLIFIGGSIVGIGFMFGMLELPLPFFHPLKLMLNLGAAGLVIGSILLLKYRLTRPERQTRGTWYDWFCMYSLLLTGITGVTVEAFRMLDIQAVAFGIYFIHLICVFCLLGYAPWSKIAHLVYRSVALVHAHYTGREKKAWPVKR